MAAVAPPRQHVIATVANRIINFTKASTCKKHIQQIQTQLINHNLHCHTTVALHFITACNSFSLLPTILPLYLHNSNSYSYEQPQHVFTYNTLIRALSKSEITVLPFLVYTHMMRNSVSPNNFTFPFLLKSLSDSGDLPRGMMVHGHVVKLGYSGDVYVGNGLMDFYASRGEVGLCRKVFGEMPERDVVSWTVLIMGYRNAGEYEDALVAFRRMLQCDDVVPNRVTMVNVLGACGAYGDIKLGVWVHDFVQRNGWELDIVLGTSLIDMYLKCGRVSEGLSVFNSMKEKNVYTWNTVINGLAFAKSGAKAIWFFDKMENKGFKADGVTLISVLSACSHLGLVETGRKIFGSLIVGKYGCAPNMKHYACFIDILARAGKLDEAFRVITEMPFLPTKSMWGSLLASSRACGNLELSEFAAKKLIELEPENSGYYTVLSNLYAEMERWTDVANVRELMRKRGLKKDSGFSSLESACCEDSYTSVTPHAA